jgi:integrase
VSCCANIWPRSTRPQTRSFFTSPRGAPLRYGNFSRRAWAPALRGAGLPHTGTHVGRRTAASLLLAAGASVVDVQHHLGHEDATTTLNNYVAVSDDARRRLAERLDEAWRRADPAGASSSYFGSRV